MSMTMIARLRARTGGGVAVDAHVSAAAVPSPAVVTLDNSPLSALSRIRAAVRPLAQGDWTVTPSSKPKTVVEIGSTKVGDSDDLKRVLALPRRPAMDLTPGSYEAEKLIDEMMIVVGKHNPRCICRSELNRPCVKRLNAIQAWALKELLLHHGLFGSIATGAGKTVIDILAAMVVPTKVAVLLIPPNLKMQLWREYLALDQHFKVPTILFDQTNGRRVPGAPVVHVIPYSKLSRPESTTLFETLQPDLVIADESHKLKNRSAAGTSRFLRLFGKSPQTRFACWSGTVTSKSVRDYAHHCAFSLREGSPLPLDTNTVEEWAAAIDDSPMQAAPGALGALCKPGEKLHDGFRRRLVETPGVVATREGAIGNTLIITDRKAPPVPAKVEALLRDLRKTWTRPDGEELVTPLDAARCARELAAGFYSRWRFPYGHVKSEGCKCKREAKQICDACVRTIEQWYAARKAWHKELRQKLEHRAEHLDSPLLCSKAAIRFYQKEAPPLGKGEKYEGDLPVWEAKSWPAWVAIREKVDPVPEAVWVDDYLCRDATEWAKENRGVVWVEHDAVGKKMAELSGLPYHAGGPKAEERILSEKGNRSIIASVKAHGTGRDGLQRLFCEQLMMIPLADGLLFEQVLARLHRVGQEQDEVTMTLYQHTPEVREALAKALGKARYIEGTTGSKQKLLYANWTFEQPRLKNPDDVDEDEDTDFDMVKVS